jgi:hypothetical protein
MRALVPLAILLVGCGVERTTAEPVTAPVEAPGTGPVEAPVIAPEPASPEPSPSIIVGRGACSSDDECVLTSFQPGCCAQACDAYPTSQAELDARVANDQCESPCPPPSPCRGPRRKLDSAICHEGVCAALERPLQP